jgi:hypothetical protein
MLNQRSRPGIFLLIMGSLLGCQQSNSKASEPADSVPQTPEALIAQAASLRREGKHDEAKDAALKAFTLARTGPRVAERIELAKAFGAAGEPASAINEIKQLEKEKRDQGVPVDEVDIAEVYAQIGDPPAVFRWLTRAVEAKSPNLADVAANPDLDPVKADPKWQEFLATLPK